MKTLTKKPVSFRLPPRVEIKAPVPAEYAKVLSKDALEFVARLEREFAERRRILLQKRWERQVELIAGKLPDFLVGTKNVQAGAWKTAASPKDLTDRRVEITGPAERKMIINGLNSGANVFMADFEDASTPSWQNMIEGQINLCDAVDGTIRYINLEGKEYRLNESTATLFMRPRGWHLDERHVTVDGHPCSASIFDFGIYLYHNARKLIERGSGPYFYLPKIESYLEARLWNDVFLMAQDELGIPRGSIRATVLIETILAAYEMDEILYELRDHSSGLNCGRWDYIFSIIKKLRHYSEYVLSDRSRLSMNSRFLHSYSLLLIQTCHRRGIHAIGGMAAQIPVRDNPEATEEAFAKVRADKVREAEDGHDGTWVAHPALVPVAKAVFDQYMPGPNQIHRQREDVEVTARDLLTIPKPVVTEDGLRLNIRAALLYMEAWLRGTGCVPINNLMEDTATAEISRAQLWQWLHHRARLADGRRISLDLYRKLATEELQSARSAVGAKAFQSGRYTLARGLLDKLVTEKLFHEFFTQFALDYLE